MGEAPEHTSTLRIPVTVCHGIMPRRRQCPLTADRYDEYLRIASELGFHTITYAQLHQWWLHGTPLPDRPWLFDIDHPERSAYNVLRPMLESHGFGANLFINTADIENLYQQKREHVGDRTIMNWDELGELAASGWHIGAHTHTHPNICDLCLEDPSGDRIRGELDTSNALLRAHLGLEVRDFAYVLETWHSLAELEVRKRYRFARLWVTGVVYWADGMLMKYQDLAGFPGPDAADGGPPIPTRYITRATNPHRLPGMEIGHLIYQFDAFRAYLEAALEPAPADPSA